MAEPWFDPVHFGTFYGGFGGVLGSVGGFLGAMARRWAPRGKARGFVLRSFSFLALLGFAQLGAGVYALIEGQPLAIWYPMTLTGGILAFVFTLLKPIVRKRYDAFEMREWVNADAPEPRLN